MPSIRLSGLREAHALCGLRTIQAYVNSAFTTSTRPIPIPIFIACSPINYAIPGKFWMDNLYCTGREKNLTDCHFDGWGNHDCEASEIAGVVCKLPPKARVVPVKSVTHLEKLKAHAPNKIKSKFEYRLTKGRTPSEGRVEVSLFHSLLESEELLMDKLIEREFSMCTLSLLGSFRHQQVLGRNLWRRLVSSRSERCLSVIGTGLCESCDADGLLRRHKRIPVAGHPLRVLGQRDFAEQLQQLFRLPVTAFLSWTFQCGGRCQLRVANGRLGVRLRGARTQFAHGGQADVLFTMRDGGELPRRGGIRDPTGASELAPGDPAAVEVHSQCVECRNG